MRRPALRFLHEVKRAHVVEPVGELHQQHADISAHRQHQLAEVFRLLGPIRLQFQPGQFGHAIDQAGDRAAEPLLDIGQLDRRILYRVVQQRGADARHVQTVRRQDFGDRNRMSNIWVAVVAHLHTMCVRRDGQRVFDQRGIRAWCIGADRLGKPEPACDGRRRRGAALGGKNSPSHAKGQPAGCHA